MDAVKAAYAQRWAAPVVLAGGLVARVVSLAADGLSVADVGHIGALLAIMAAVRVGYLARTDHARATYRYIRCAERTEPVVTLTARDDT